MPNPEGLNRRSFLAAAGGAEAVIAHAVPGVRGTYDRWAFLPEKAEALESWAGLAADIVDPARKIIASRKI